MDDLELKTEKRVKEKPVKSGKVRRFWIFFVIILLVLAAVLVAAYRDGTGLDVLKRYFTYGSTKSSGGEESFVYEASTGNRFAVLGDSLVVLSNNTLQVLNGEGSVTWSTSVKMTTPVLFAGGGRAVAYDAGGLELYVVDEKGEVFNYTAEETEPLLSATLNDQGWMAVTKETENYKDCVCVYSDQMEQVFLFNSSERFVTDAWVTDDNKNLAAVTLGQEDSVFVSNIVLYNLTEEDPEASYDVSNGLVLSIGELDGKIATVSDTCLTFGNLKGEITANYDYSSEYLREFSTGDGYMVLLLNRYQSGSVGRLTTVNGAGEELASLDINDEVLSISAAGRYIAVLYADNLVIYTQALQEYATLTGTDYAKGVLMREDGSALLISSEKATLFLP